MFFCCISTVFCRAVFTSVEKRRDWHLGARQAYFQQWKEGSDGGREEDSNEQSAPLLFFNEMYSYLYYLLPKLSSVIFRMLFFN